MCDGSKTYVKSFTIVVSSVLVVVSICIDCSAELYITRDETLTGVHRAEILDIIYVHLLAQ